MGSSKGGGGSDQTVTTEPWGPAQGYLVDALRQSQSLFGQGSPGAYPGQIVAEMNPYQTGAIDWMAQRAIQGSPTQDLANQALEQQIAGVPNPTYGFFGGTMNNPLAGAGQALPQAYEDIALTRQMNPAMPMLGETASGGFLNANPYLDQMYNQAAQQVGENYSKYLVPGYEGARTMVGQYTRPGSDVSPTAQWYRDQVDYQGLGRPLQELATSIYGGNYARERGLQQAAQQAMGGFYNQGIQQALASTGQLGQLGQAGLAGQMAGAEGLGGQFGQDLTRQLGAIGMAPGMAAADYADINQLLGAGGLLQQQRQRELGGEAQRWQDEFYGPGSPQAWLNDYVNRVGSVGGMGGTQEFEGSGGGSSTMANILGGALGGAGLAEMFGGGGFSIGGGPLGDAMFGPSMGMTIPYAVPAALAGGLLGGLF